MDLGEPPFNWDELAVWACCHVAAGQHGGKHVRDRLELPGLGRRRVRVRRLRRWRRSDGRPVGTGWRRRARRRAGSGRREDFPPSCKVNPIHAMQHDYINLGRGARLLMREALGCPKGTHGAYLHENLIGAARRRPTRRCSRQPPSPGGAAGRRNGTGRRASRRPGRAP
jgi:hypothetical protein